MNIAAKIYLGLGTRKEIVKLVYISVVDYVRINILQENVGGRTIQKLTEAEEAEYLNPPLLSAKNVVITIILKCLMYITQTGTIATTNG